MVTALGDTGCQKRRCEHHVRVVLDTNIIVSGLMLPTRADPQRRLVVQRYFSHGILPPCQTVLERVQEAVMKKSTAYQPDLIESLRDQARQKSI